MKVEWCLKFREKKRLLGSTKEPISQSSKKGQRKKGELVRTFLYAGHFFILYFIINMSYSFVPF